MTPAKQPRRSARAAQKLGNVSQQAQARVDERVRAIMARRDDAESSASPVDPAESARRFLRRRAKSPR
jgi:hypothetical protein